ncbi:MAG: carboxypeptidase-like regulatory domain-containing protein [Candidatus Acidiferrales bacterium]
MNLRRRIIVVGFLLASLAGAPALPLQGGEKDKGKSYALLSGSVHSAEGFALAGVPVSVRRDDDRKPRWRAVSDTRGEFALRLPSEAATYEVATESKEHKNQTKTVKVAGTDKETVVVLFRLSPKNKSEKSAP